MLRELIDFVFLTPVDDQRGQKVLPVDHCRLAGILSMTNKSRKSLDLRGPLLESMKLVAGAGFEPATFGL